MPKNREDKEKHNDDQKNTDGDAVKEEEEEDDEESSSGDEENDATGYVHAWTSRQKKTSVWMHKRPHTICVNKVGSNQILSSLSCTPRKWTRDKEEEEENRKINNKDTLKIVTVT